MNGYCKRPNECRCKLGFYGDNCNRCIPLPGCQHGSCKVSFECVCHKGWDGIFCSEREYDRGSGVGQTCMKWISIILAICREDCHPSRGYCESPGECRCRLGWAGATCRDCQVLPGCMHGTCTKPLECKCLPGWTGILCQTRKMLLIVLPKLKFNNGNVFQPSAPRTVAENMDIADAPVSAAVESDGWVKTVASVTHIRDVRTVTVADLGNATVNPAGEECCAMRSWTTARRTPTRVKMVASAPRWWRTMETSNVSAHPDTRARTARFYRRRWLRLRRLRRRWPPLALHRQLSMSMNRWRVWDCS